MLYFIVKFLTIVFHVPDVTKRSILQQQNKHSQKVNNYLKVKAANHELKQLPSYVVIKYLGGHIVSILKLY